MVFEMIIICEVSMKTIIIFIIIIIGIGSLSCDKEALRTDKAEIAIDQNAVTVVKANELNKFQK